MRVREVCGKEFSGDHMYDNGLQYYTEWDGDDNDVT